MSREKIGVFGSAFNPPSLGHLDALKQSLEIFDRILLVPSAAHAFAKPMLPFKHREAMLKLFAQDTDMGSRLEVCAVEAELLANLPDQPVYTFDLMECLEKRFPDSELGYIRGPDNADPETWARYYKASEIEQRWAVFTVQQRVDIRSTYIRDLLNSDLSDDKLEKAMQRLLFPSVYRYILKHCLYHPNDR